MKYSAQKKKYGTNLIDYLGFRIGLKYWISIQWQLYICCLFCCRVIQMNE
jgi:hypothetical protein